MTPIKDASIEARCLSTYMSDLSEDRWCAGWMGGLEFILWGALHGITTEEDPDDCFVLSEREIADLKRLHELSGGWVVWDDTVGGAFLTTEEWKARLLQENENG